MQDGRLDKELLWIPPYDVLRLWTRIWFDQHKMIQRACRFKQSSTLRIIGRLAREELESIVEFHKDWRSRAERHIGEAVEETVEWRAWGMNVVGLGKQTLGKLLGLIGNPAARTYPSSLWRHCGLAVINGKLEKPKKGEPLHYNVKAKSQVYVIVSQFLKSYPRTPNFYAEAYYEYRQRFKEKHPEWTKAHCHYAAILKVGKFFLSHLHTVSRREQGLPVSKPYPIQHMGHLVYYDPAIALHPRKCRSEVVEAIMEVMEMLKNEQDEEVADFHWKFIKNFAEKV